MIQNRTVYVILVVTILMIVAQLKGNYMLFAYTMPTLIFAFIFLGSIQKNKLPVALSAGWVILFGLVLTSLIMMLKMSESAATITDTLVLGLPKSTFILLAVFWAFTGVVSTAFYAIRFDKDVLSDKSFEEFVAKAKEVK